jgi:thiosulfate/3-mercaptopyruvate sulfurtransferase
MIARIIKYSLILPVACILALTFSFTNDGEDTWNKDQLIEPGQLSRIIIAYNNVPLIYSIGPSGTIAGAKEIGPTVEKENIDKLRKELSTVSKDKAIVIYCGCCPFKNCPNIRPAFVLLNEMGFKNHKLLDLSTNLKADWIDKGYPMAR